MKKIFETPMIEVVVFEKSDILTLSGAATGTVYENIDCGAIFGITEIE